VKLQSVRFVKYLLLVRALTLWASLWHFHRTVHSVPWAPPHAISVLNVPGHRFPICTLPHCTSLSPRRSRSGTAEACPNCLVYKDFKILQSKVIMSCKDFFLLSLCFSYSVSKLGYCRCDSSSLLPICAELGIETAAIAVRGSGKRTSWVYCLHSHSKVGDTLHARWHWPIRHTVYIFLSFPGWFIFYIRQCHFAPKFCASLLLRGRSHLNLDLYIFETLEITILWYYTILLLNLV
jgi:hypothetical protein